MSQRLRYLREQHGAALLDAFRSEPRNEAALDDLQGLSNDDAADAVFAMLRNADPTRTGACTQWLIRQAVAGRLPAEDLGKARETLEAFQIYKRRLPAEVRDLGRYDTLGDVWNAVKPHVLAYAPVSGKDEDRREREAARAESTILLEQDGWTVAVPKSKRAAIWWGRGTRWCTSSEQSDAFESYTNRGPLIVFLRPDGEKFQFHAATNQFMDAPDNEANPESALTSMPQDTPTARALLAALFPDGGEKDDLHFAVAHLGLPLNRVPEEWRDYGLCLDAVKAYGRALEDVPLAIRDRTMCMEAVRSKGSSLEFVPDRLKNRSMCRTAVEKYGPAVQHVPERLRSREMVLDAIRRDTATLRFLPRDLHDRDLCIEAIRNGGSLGSVRYDLIDRDMCLEAVRKDGLNLHWVPEQWVDREMCFEAARGEGQFVLRDVPDELCDREFFLEAVKNHASVPFDAPAHLLTLEICMDAVRINKKALSYIPYEFQQACRDAIENDPLEHGDHEAGSAATPPANKTNDDEEAAPAPMPA